MISGRVRDSFDGTLRNVPRTRGARRLATHPALLPALLLCACTSPSGSGALRPDTATVFEGQTFTSTNILNPNHYRVHVRDVLHDRDGWVLTVDLSWPSQTTFHGTTPFACSNCTTTVGSAGGGDDFHVVRSTDGATWSPVTFTGHWPGGALIGVHRVNGQALLVGASLYETALARLLQYTVTHADLATGELLPDAALDGQSTFARPQAFEGRLAGVTTDPSATFGAVESMSWDGASFAKWTYTFPAGAHLGSRQERQLRSVDGRLFAGYMPYTQPDRQCRVEFDLGATDHTPTLRCAPASAAPQGLDMSYSTARGVVGLANQQADPSAPTQALAFDVPADGMGRVMPLGDGTVRDGLDTPPRIRQPFGRLLRLDDAGAPRFRSLRADGSLVELTFPRSPCQDESACAGEIEWIEPLGNDDYMVFWVINDTHGAVFHEFVYARREHVVPVDVAPIPVAQIPIAPWATEAGALEQACELAASCFPNFTTRTACTMEWGGQLSLLWRSDTYRRFVAARSCADLVAASPALGLLGQPCSSNEVCRGTTLITCLQGQIASAVDCGRTGVGCVDLGGGVAECSDGSSATTPTGCSAAGVYRGTQNCTALGLMCVPNVGCGAPGTCPSGGVACEGNLSVMCANGRRMDQPCDASGTVCNPATGGCVQANEHVCGLTSTTGSGLAEQCYGPYVLVCHGGAGTTGLHWIDCRTLGFGTCVQPDVSMEARCQ